MLLSVPVDDDEAIQRMAERANVKPRDILRAALKAKITEWHAHPEKLDEDLCLIRLEQ